MQRAVNNGYLPHDPPRLNSEDHCGVPERQIATLINAAHGHALVLPAIGAAWEGFGFPGDSLSLLIVPHSPFTFPGAVKEAEKEAFPSLRSYAGRLYRKCRSSFAGGLGERSIPGRRYHSDMKGKGFRAGRNRQHSGVPLNTKGRSLLTDMIYCAHCGNRLTLTTCGKRKMQADGTYGVGIYSRYQCHYNVRHPGECDGQSGYSVKKVDAAVEYIIKRKFSEIAAASARDIQAHQREKEAALAKSRADAARAQVESKKKVLVDLKRETIKVIRGQSALNKEYIDLLFDETSSALNVRIRSFCASWRAPHAAHLHPNRFASPRNAQKSSRKRPKPAFPGTWKRAHILIQ